MLFQLALKTGGKQDFIEVTEMVCEKIRQSGCREGLAHVYCPHTTAGITVNENADPDVKKDVLKSLDEIVEDIGFSHVEGNSPAHVKSSLMGCGKTFIVSGGKPVLGRWQGIYFAEFDGPRQREIILKILCGK